MDPRMPSGGPPGLGVADEELAKEYLRLKERVRDARDRADRLRALADHVEAQAADDERVLGELEGILGLAAQMQIEELDRELGGRRLQEIAVELLARELQPGQ